MQIMVGSRTLDLRFGYETREGVTFTTCVVLEIGDAGSEDKPIGHSLVKKHPKQNHCRFIARRHALSRALAKVDRTERAEIWKAYLKVVRAPKK